MDTPATPALEARRGRARRRSRRRRLSPLAGFLLLATALLLLAAGAWGYRSGVPWLDWLRLGRPPGIIVHHSATPAYAHGRLVTAAQIDEAHAHRGWGRTDRSGRVYHIGYHYVVLADGTVQAGRPERMRGAHCDGHNDMLGICLVGDFTKRPPPPVQLAAAAALTRRLSAKYRLTPTQVHRHRDLDTTACPGASFPWAQFKGKLTNGK